MTDLDRRERSPPTLLPTRVAVLPLRDFVVFPRMIVPLFVGRPKSMRALDIASDRDKQIFVVAQTNSAEDDPTAEDLHRVGTLSTIQQLQSLSDGTMRVHLKGECRARLTEFLPMHAHFEGSIDPITEVLDDPDDLTLLARMVASQFERYWRTRDEFPPYFVETLGQIGDASELADTIAPRLTLQLDQTQELLEIARVGERLRRMSGYIEAAMATVQPWQSGEGSLETRHDD